MSGSQVDLIGRLLVQALMTSLVVIPLKITFQSTAQCLSIPEGLEIQAPVFGGPPQALDEDVVAIAALAVHTDLDAVVLE
jgi:hypothetical protein